MKYLLGVSEGFKNFITGSGIWIVIGVLAGLLVISIVFLIINIKKERQKFAKGTTAAEIITPDSDVAAPQIKTKAKKKSVKANIAEKQDKIEETPAVKDVYEINYEAPTREWVVKKVGALRAVKRFQSKEEATNYIDKLNSEN